MAIVAISWRLGLSGSIGKTADTRRMPDMVANYFRRAGLGLFIIHLAALTFFSSKLNAEAQDEAKNKPSHQINSYVRYIPGRSVEGMPGEVKIVESVA